MRARWLSGNKVGGVSETPDGIVLRPIEVADLREILGELDEFWDERDMAFLHQAFYVHEFGETSVLAQEHGEILAYLLGFVSQDGGGYVHAVAVRRRARRPRARAAAVRALRRARPRARRAVGEGDHAP